MPFVNCISGCAPVECGLIFHIHHVAVPVPLRKVNINAKVVDFVSEVRVEQIYVNEEKRPIEAVYMFPVEEAAAVIDFIAEVEGRTIHTEVRKKEEAKEAYDKAMQDHQTAVLLEESTPDIFRIKLGQLKPGAGAKITLVYITELPVEEDAVRLTIPTTIAPRYVPPTDDSEAAKTIAAIPYSLNTPAPMKFNMDLICRSAIKSVTSPSHSITADITPEANKDGHFSGKASLSGNTADLNKDLVMLIKTENPHEPRVFIEKVDESVVAMVSLVPSFKLRDQKTEMIFLVDRSGSMGADWRGEGGSIQAAKKALTLFLHSLPVDCYFNIFSFGSHFDSLFSDGSKKYDDNTLASAKTHVSGMDANYGGTEIFQPLQAIFKQPAIEGYLRQIFVLTDGEVSNAHQIIQLVKKNNASGRVFALGLGASASRHLVKGLARAGNGTAEFAAENEDLRPKVMTQLKNALQPSIADVNLTWEGVPVEAGLVADKEEEEVETKKTLLGFMKPKEKGTPSKKQWIHHHGQAPANIPPIYDGSRLLVYRLFPPGAPCPTTVKICANTPDGPLSVDLPINDGSHLEAGNFVHQLAARQRIQDLEEFVIDNNEAGGITEEDLKNAITELGIKYRLASKHTSFVGVDDKASKKDDFELAMVTRDIKNQVPSGFGYLGGGFAPVGMAIQSFSCGPVTTRTRKAKWAATSTGGVSRRLRASPPDQFGGGPPMAMACFAAATPGISNKMPARRMMMDEELEECCGSKSDEFVPMCDDLSVPLSPPAKEAVDDLTALIDLQSSDGHFRWGEAISKRTGKSQVDLMTKRSSLAINDDAWVTAIVIALLEAMTDDKDLWELVVLKARQYLARQLANDVIKVDALIADAKLVSST